jgi:hypothetical protein
MTNSNFFDKHTPVFILLWHHDRSVSFFDRCHQNIPVWFTNLVHHIFEIFYKLLVLNECKFLVRISYYSSVSYGWRGNKKSCGLLETVCYWFKQGFCQRMFGNRYHPQVNMNVNHKSCLLIIHIDQIVFLKSSPYIFILTFGTRCLIFLPFNEANRINFVQSSTSNCFLK